MGVRNLYLRIYLTVVAVLLVFALVVGGAVQHFTESERGRIESDLDALAIAWAELLEKSLPPSTATVEVQSEAVMSWGDRLRLPLALDDAQGQRIATTHMFEKFARKVGNPSGAATQYALADGRVLWVGRPKFGPDFGGRRPHRHGPPVMEGGGPPPGPDLGRGDLRPPDDGPRGDRPPFKRDKHVLPRWLLESSWAVLLLMGGLFVAVAAGSYPVVRRLTRRLETLKKGVETFGAGQLGHRVRVDGQDEVAALAASFNQAAQRVEDLVTSNRSLLANASHELRSPLARLKMAVEMLELTPEERREGLREEIRRDIRELDALVDEVLLASRLDASATLSMAPVELVGLLAEEAARIDASVEVAPGAAAAVTWGDERLLRRAVRNLLENARRYGGHEVEAQLLSVDHGAGWEVRVCDRGLGVPADQRERIFEPFYRMPGHAERAGGVGLGLALVRQIAQRHGGSARCDAREGGGSCFVIRVPAHAPHSG